MRKNNFKARIIYGILFIAILVTEVLIALFVRDAFIRPYGGDILVTILICCFVRIFIPERVRMLPVWVFLFSLAIEIGQYFDYVSLLGLGESEFFRIVLGTGFSFIDIVCYAAGCVIFFACEKIVKYVNCFYGQKEKTMKYCDLHIHSNGSDGDWSIEQIVTEAKKLSLTIALTDHNTVVKLPEFLAEAERQGVRAIGGTEVTTGYEEYEFHLLGLFIDPEHYDTIDRPMKEYCIRKEFSNMETVERLNEAGYIIDYKNVKKRQPNGNANRKHIAEELVANNPSIKSTDDAFATVLKEGNGFYVTTERLPLIETIKLLRSIKAVPVLAHPLKDVKADVLRKILPEAVEAGLLGMETMHSSYDEEQMKIADEIAEEFGLLKSGGSDFHGPAKKGVHMGVGKGNMAVPISFYEKLLEAKNSL